jgi:hypothetical protein
MADQVLTDNSLTRAAVETWVHQVRGAKFICFKNSRGELFHFKSNQLMRGRPIAPFNRIEEFTRSADVLTIENAHHMSGITVKMLRYWVKTGQLPAVKRRWRYGSIGRCGILINLKDLQDFMAKQAITKYVGKVEWDVNPREVLDKNPTVEK